MDGYDKNDELEKRDRDEIFSKAVRAGKRTYFFDVKATRKDDYYITLTESKKRFNKDGRFFFEKHKIFLYKEDFEKFVEGLNEVISYINENNPIDYTKSYFNEDEDEMNSSMVEEYHEVQFEDLDERR